MSLTFFFVVLSIGIGYLLYENFKKSRQLPPKPSEALNSRLRVMYSQECKVLNSLQQSKKSSIMTRTISISLQGPCEITNEQLLSVRQVIMHLNRSRRIYLLKKIGSKPSQLFQAIQQVIGDDYTIPYASAEGGVAVLRQLGCGLHLEADYELYIKIKQYINKIWLVGTDQEQQALREFKTQTEMISFLANIQSIEE